MGFNRLRKFLVPAGDLAHLLQLWTRSNGKLTLCCMVNASINGLMKGRLTQRAKQRNEMWCVCVRVCVQGRKNKLCIAWSPRRCQSPLFLHTPNLSTSSDCLYSKCDTRCMLHHRHRFHGDDIRLSLKKVWNTMDIEIDHLTDKRIVHRVVLYTTCVELSHGLDMSSSCYFYFITNKHWG